MSIVLSNVEKIMDNQQEFSGVVYLKEKDNIT